MITDIGKGKTVAQKQMQPERGVRICQTRSFSGTKVREEGAGDSPSACGKYHGELGCLIAAMEVNGGITNHE